MQANRIAVRPRLHTQILSKRGTLVVKGATLHGWVRTSARNRAFGTAGVQAASRGRENRMGDRGGKKDKTKSQQQLATKQKQKDERKQDKAPSRTPSASKT